MRALALEKENLRIKEIPLPHPEKNEALIKVRKAGICSTDLEIMKGYMSFNGVLGHEFVGDVTQAHVKKWKGKRVVGEINIPCRTCAVCRQGLKKHCTSRKTLGISAKDGAFAEYLTLPLENLHMIPQEISDNEAVFVEPLAAAFRILEQVEIRRSDLTLVLGDGKMGLLIAQVLCLRSDHVYCIGKHKRKLDLLLNKGVKTSLIERSQKKEIKFDIVVEATGSEEGLSEAMRRVKPCGKVVLKSTFSGRSRVDVSKIVVDEIELIGSRCGPFGTAIESLKKKQIEVENMIDHVFPIEEAGKAFSEAEKSEVIKVLIAL